MTRRRLVGTALVLLAIVGVVVAEIATSGNGQSSTRPAPALPKEVLAGPRVDLKSLRGKPAVINFWASWCAPCRQEAPELRRFAGQIGHRATLVGVDWNDKPDNARAFIAQSHWHYPVLRDSTGSAGTAYGLAGLPTTFVLNARGKIVQKLQGPQTTSTLNSALAAAG